MSVFLGLGSLIGFFVSLIFLIIKTIKKKPKKRALIALCVCLVLFFVALAMPQPETTEELPTPAPVVATPTPTPTSTPVPTQTPEAATITDIEYVKSYLEIVLKSAYDYAEVEGDETGLTVNIASEGLAAALAVTQAQGTDEGRQAWETAKDGLLDAYNSISDYLQESGFESTALMMNVLNDENHDNTLLMIYYGEIVYDALS